eukprot:TRINITY_DN18657_c1_g1_i1.p1 TRINITY_DN18657_c1_g1~~TRINITY_DN18657_c1_g1_i1.p1  ORF type:complete len:1319 (+),score=434.33 TRINITY_DN18657_c1_g1_i1:3397-7353(+)
MLDTRVLCAVLGVVLCPVMGTAPAPAPPPPPTGTLPNCEKLKTMDRTDLLSTCFIEKCEDPQHSEDAERCLNNSKITTASPNYINPVKCEKERCTCAFGEDAWDCVNKECREKCNNCTCYDQVFQNRSRSQHPTCEAEYQVCMASLIEHALKYTFDKTVFTQCKGVVHCTEELSEHHQCVERYIHEGNDACAESSCSTSHEVTFKIKGEHGEHVIPYNILVLAIVVALGNLCRHFGDIFPLSHLPYTVQVFILGAAWGAACKGLGGAMLKYGKLGDIDPHLLFFIFLPILIFESAFATDFHVFKKVAMHCIFLAGPGLMIASLLTALVAHLIFTEYKWDLVTSLLFGCMLSATDPVAVVALLKELGAAPAISQLIEGESLLNDGTAIVFFNIFKGSVVGGEVKESIWVICLVLIKVAGGGCCLGWVIGVITKNCIKAVFNDAEIEITMTLVAAYVTFFVAEVYLEVSGVLGLVVMGMYLSYHSHVISPEVEHSLHHFWEIIVYIGNTLIFAIAGLVITEKALDELNGYDLYYLVINYVFLNIIRGVAMAILIVPMNLIGKYQLDWRNAVLCTWGGLRGAVGLALALIIWGDNEIAAEHPLLGARFLFHVAGVVVLTLCVNGVTTGYVVSKLGLDVIPDTRKRSMQRAFKQLMKNSTDNLYLTRRRHVFRDANWREVTKFAIGNFYDPFNDTPLIEEAWVDQDACEHYYRTFAAAIEHEYEAGTMLPSSLRVLISLLAEVENKAAVEGQFTMIDAQHLNEQFEERSYDRFVGGLRNRWTHAFDVSIGFLNCHEYVQNHIDGVCHTSQACNKVKDHCKTARNSAIAILENRSTQRPEIAMALKSRNAARDVLNKSRGFVANQIHTGKISGADGALLKSMVEKKMKELKTMGNSLMREAPEDVLMAYCSWYTRNTATYLQYKVETFFPGTNLLGKKNDGKVCYVILSGVVRVHIGIKAEVFGPGYTVGLMSILTGKLGKYSEVFAETPITAARFDASDIRHNCTNHKELIELMWDDCCKMTARKVMATLPIYQTWDHVKLMNFAENGKRHAVSFSEAYPTPIPSDHVSVLVSGEWKDILQGRECGEGPCIVPVHLTSAIFTRNSVLFCIKNPLTPQEKARKHWSKISNKIFTVRAIAALQGHEAGRKAVVEVLEGRMTSMFPKAGVPQPVSAHTTPGQTPQPLVPQSTHNGSLSSPVTSLPQRSPNRSTSPGNFPTANGMATKRYPQRNQRASSRNSTEIEMNTYTPITRVRPASRPDIPTESTPWFSQTAKGASAHNIRIRDAPELQAPLLHTPSSSSRQSSEMPFFSRVASQGEFPKSF